MSVALRAEGEILLLRSVVLGSLFECVVREVVDVVDEFVQGDSMWQIWFASMELSTTLLVRVKPWETDPQENRGKLVPRKPWEAGPQETAC
jgi:hypothetical protein